MTVLGHEVFYQDMGAGQPLVLLHGLSSNHRTWRHVVDQLATRYRVLVPDMPGCGLSSRPDARYSVEWQARMLCAWLSRLNVESCDLVGHSYGGGVAQYMLLLDRKRRIRRLGLVAAGGLGRAVALHLRLASACSWLENFGDPLMAHAIPYFLRAAGDIISDEEARWLREVHARPGSTRAFMRTVRDAVDWRGQRLLMEDHIHRLQELPPVALFWGTNDRIIPWQHGLETTRRLCGSSLTLFEDCGHFPQVERPEEFVSALCHFLDASVLPRARFVPTARAAEAQANLLRRLARAVGTTLLPESKVA